jgi:hypothetical protein
MTLIEYCFALEDIRICIEGLLRKKYVSVFVQYVSAVKLDSYVMDGGQSLIQ